MYTYYCYKLPIINVKGKPGKVKIKKNLLEWEKGVTPT